MNKWNGKSSPLHDRFIEEASGKRLSRLTKYHNLRSMGEREIIFEGFFTGLACIECFLTSRPSTVLSNYLTDMVIFNWRQFFWLSRPTTAWKFSQQIKQLSKIPEMYQLFGKVWAADYLNLLQKTPKWLSSTKIYQSQITTCHHWNMDSGTYYRNF